MPREDSKINGGLSYDQENEVFIYNGNQLYWSSLYILDKSKKGFKFGVITKELALDREEMNLAFEEIRDLEKFSLINRKGDDIEATPKGIELLKKAGEIVSLDGLKEKAKTDLSRTEQEIDKANKQVNNHAGLPSEVIGYEQPLMFCPKCAKSFERDQMRCPSCGEENPYEQFPLKSYILNMAFFYFVIIIVICGFFALFTLFSNPASALIMLFVGVGLALFYGLIIAPLGGVFEWIAFNIGRFIREMVFKRK